MTTVVDLGCHDHEQWRSLDVLAELFKPDRIYGFDPDPAVDVSRTETQGITTVVERKAAWTADETLNTVDCFDFSAWLVENGPAVVKCDIEGAEYPVLRKVIRDGNDDLVEFLMVEWHDDVDDEIVRGFSCPYMRWWM